MTNRIFIGAWRLANVNRGTLTMRGLQVKAIRTSLEAITASASSDLPRARARLGDDPKRLQEARERADARASIERKRVIQGTDCRVKPGNDGGLVGVNDRSYSARHTARKLLCLSGLLALEGAKAGTIGLLIEKLLHALGAAVFLVDETQGFALGAEVVGRLRFVHETHRA